MITQIDYDNGDGESLKSKDATHAVDATESQEAPEAHDNDQLRIAGKSGDAHDDKDAVAGEEDDFAEEDAWLLACHFLDDDEGKQDTERYVPQLMDAREMRQLRVTLRKSETQIRTCGRMREFTPRKPVASPESHARRRNSNLATQRHGKNPSLSNINSNSGGFDTGNAVQHQQQQQKNDALLTLGPTRAFLTSVPPTAAALSSRMSQQKQDFALVLRRELRQVRGSLAAMTPCYTLLLCSLLM